MTHHLVIGPGEWSGPEYLGASVISVWALLMAAMIGWANRDLAECGLVTIAIVVGLIGSEFLARSAGMFVPRPRFVVGEIPNNPSKSVVIDERIGWRMVPNQVTTAGSTTYRSNDRGFRIGDGSSVTSSVTVALVGDSFTFGVGLNYQETFGAHLEQMLGAHVENYGQPGFGVDSMWMVVRHEVVPRRPDLIVLAFIDDDLDRALTAFRAGEGRNKPTFVLDRRILRPQVPGDALPQPLSWLDQHSHLWQVGYFVDMMLSYRVPFGERYAVNVALFEAVRDEANAAKIPLVVVRLPRRRPGHYRPVTSALESMGVANIDLSAPDRRRPSHPIHFDDDEHTNAAGNIWIAAEIAPFLRKQHSELFPP